jgi:hypothetical protein
LADASIDKQLLKQDANGVACSRELVRFRAPNPSVPSNIENYDIVRVLVGGIQEVSARIEVEIPRRLTSGPRPLLVPKFAAASLDIKDRNAIEAPIRNIKVLSSVIDDNLCDVGASNVPGRERREGLTPRETAMG